MSERSNITREEAKMLQEDADRALSALSNLTDDEFWRVAGRFDSVGDESREDVKFDLVGKATVFDAMEAVTGEKLSAILSREDDD